LSIYKHILGLSPWIEVIIKSLYWRSAFFHSLLSSKKKLINTKRINQPKVTLGFSSIKKALNILNAGHTGIMIVHSSMKVLSTTNLTPDQICKELIDFLGPEGTLVMPAIPLYREEPVGLERLKDAICTKRIIYDVRRTKTWTGDLPKTLKGLPGAIRSRHPLNTLVAIGPQATKMMKHNIEGSLPKPCGPQSSWKYCADRDATIVCLGVDTAPSLTMLHVAEDCWPENWALKNWYRQRKFHVIDGDYKTDLNVLERHPRWSINFAPYTLQKDLLKLGIVKVAEIDGIRVESCSSAELINYLTSKRPSSYPYWIPFWDKIR
jgi:aminoglycoside 3-N-acetyltransferase